MLTKLHMTRLNTPAIKMALTKVLQDKSSSYFAYLTEYLLGRLPKQKFDTLASGLLGKNVYLHNALVIAILHNCQPGMPKPQSSELNAKLQIPMPIVYEAAAKRKFNDPLIISQQRKKMRFKQVMTLDQNDRHRILLMKQQQMDNHVSLRDQPVYHKMLQEIPNFKGLVKVPASSVESGDLPSRETIRQRVQFLSGIAGLTSQVSNPVVSMLEIALENYMKNVLDALVPRLKMDEETRKKRLDIEEILFSLDLNPFLLGGLEMRDECLAELRIPTAAEYQTPDDLERWLPLDHLELEVQRKGSSSRANGIHKPTVPVDERVVINPFTSLRLPHAKRIAELGDLSFAGGTPKKMDDSVRRTASPRTPRRLRRSSRISNTVDNI